MEAQNSSLEIQFKLDNEQQIDITPFREKYLPIKRKIYQIQLKLAEVVYNIIWEETRLQEISAISTDFITRTLEVPENVQGQLTLMSQIWHWVTMAKSHFPYS